MKIVASAHRLADESLAQRSFRLAGAEVARAASDGLIERVRADRPQLVVLVETPSHDGLSLCEQIKRDADLSATRVMLLLDSPPDDLDFERLAAAGADEIVLSHVPGEQLYPAAARLCGLPELSLDTPAEIDDGGGARPAEVANLSARSLDLLSIRPIASNARLQIALRRDIEAAPLMLEGDVVRSDGGGDRAFRARVQLAEMPTATHERLHDLSLWDARPLPDGGLRIDVRGAFDQASDFAFLDRHLTGEVARGLLHCLFDLSRVGRITSWGARAWILFLRGLPEPLAYRFVNGSTLFTRHCSMVADMLGRGQVLSVALPYECAGCGGERARMAHRDWLTPRVCADPPPFRCATCGGQERFAELPDRYFSFLRA